MLIEDKQKLDENVRKVVSQSALRKLRGLADESKRDDISKVIFAKRMLFVFAGIFVLVLAISLISPQFIVGALRTATASIH
jgi:hypothetical protein